MSKEPRAVARSTDPGTSWEAARSVQEITEKQGEVLAAFRGRKDMADEDLVLDLQRAGSRQSPSGIRTRRAELVAMGLLADTGDRVVGSTGRRMILWGLPPKIVPNPISPLRSPGRYEPPAGDPECPEHGATCRKVWHRADQPSDPNFRLAKREGKPDQYVNVRKAEAQALDATRRQREEDEIARKKATRRVDPSTHRLVFGGPTLCRDCGGDGGSLWEACRRCSGSGLT